MNKLRLTVLWLWLPFCLASCVSNSPIEPASSTPALGCVQTPYVAGGPPDANLAAFTATWYGNAGLWAGLDPRYHGKWYTASGGLTVHWWHADVGLLTVEGRHLDGEAPPLRVELPAGDEPSGYQISRFYFPSEGCWEITGRMSQDTVLRFVVNARTNPPDVVIAVVTSTPTPRPLAHLPNGECPVSQPIFSITKPPNVDTPSAPPPESHNWFGNNVQWVLLPPGGEYHFEEYPLVRPGMKFMWWSTVGGALQIMGARLDAVAPPLEGRTSPSYGFPGFQPVTLYFPTEGCWEVVGKVGENELRFVVRVSLRPPLPLPTPAPKPTALPTVAGLADLKAPTPQPGFFWATDEPKDLPPLAFGTLPRDNQPGPSIDVRAYDLAADLPPSPHDLDVYLVGDYPANYCSVLLNIVKSLQGWDCVPLYSLVQDRAETPLGEKMAVVSQASVESRAMQLLRERGLLLPDQAVPTTHQSDDGTWRVWFFQRIHGLPVYANKGLAVSFNRDGQATNIIGRRRPLLAYSRYPARSPEEAWRLLKAGKARSLFVDDASPPHGGVIERFTQVELAYAEVEVIAAQQVMQPYYVFRADTGQTLYVPAVADPYVTW